MSGYDLYKMIMTQQSFKIPFYEEIFIVSYPSLFFLKQVTEKKFRNVLSRPPPPLPTPSERFGGVLVAESVSRSTFLNDCGNDPTNYFTPCKKHCRGDVTQFFGF